MLNFSLVEPASAPVHPLQMAGGGEIDIGEEPACVPPFCTATGGLCGIALPVQLFPDSLPAAFRREMTWTGL